MTDKEIVNDVLSMVNSSLTGYANVISQSENQQLRQTLQQIRNSDEQFQFQLAQMATQKGFYKPAGQASQQEINQVKTQLTQG
ncbi:spore coat protein [Candidatus Syntrophocurvum alkaliphilum]|nr:spore coat protein [Candidatus Syntrophocurvum alkaliphilum]